MLTKDEIREWDNAYIAGTYARSPLYAESGKGAICTDKEGKEYIDFSSGIGVNSLGFCDSGWVEAVCSQAKKLQHISNLYYTEPQAELAKMLCDRSFAKKIFFANSGAEANEGMIKAARKYSFDKYGAGRHKIITLVNSFHGRTVTTLSATGQQAFHKFFDPFTEGFEFVEAGDEKALEAALSSDDVCGIMLEFIQGEGGVIELSEDYIRYVEDVCRKRDILLLADEVQTGIGRTGSFLCCENYGVVPDIASLAKGLGGGLPIGAVLLGEKCMNTLTAGTHGSTFGGNPVSCAGAMAVLSRIDEDMLSDIRKKGEYIRAELLKVKGVAAVTGKGLMIGILPKKTDSKTAVSECLERGLIVLTAKEKIRLLPPLNISYDEINRGLEILKEVLS